MTFEDKKLIAYALSYAVLLITCAVLAGQNCPDIDLDLTVPKEMLYDR